MALAEACISLQHLLTATNKSDINNESFDYSSCTPENLTGLIRRAVDLLWHTGTPPSFVNDNSLLCG